MKKKSVMFCVVIALLFSLSSNVALGKEVPNNSKKHYEVTFKPEGGVFSDQKTMVKQIEEKQVVGQPASPVKEGYRFSGWFSDQKLTKPWDFKTEIVGNTTLFAKWEPLPNHQVTFNTGGGTLIEPQKVKDSQGLPQVQAPTKEGHRFIGWYSDAALTKAWDVKAPIKGATTLYAKWEPILNSYSVKFDTGGGSRIAPQQVTENQVATLPIVPTKEGMTFDGWYSDSTLTTSWEASTPVKANQTVHVKWLKVDKEFQVSFNADGGTEVVPQVVKEKGLVVEPKAPTKAGVVFGGWYSDQQLTKAWDFQTPVTADVVLYAKWTAPIAEFKVSFNTEGGTAVAPQTVKEKGLVVEPQAPTKLGSVFGGWYSDQQLTKVWGFQTPVTADVVLYAKWSAPIAEFKVSFNTEGGTAVAPQTVKEKGLVVEPQAPTKVGSVFGGWYSDQQLTKVWDFQTPVTADVVLYAKWTVPVAEFKVSFATNGGSTVASQTVQANQVISQPQVPTKKGYLFAGWYSDEKLTKAWDFTTPVTKDVTLYAKWNLVVEPVTEFQVTFNSNGGSAVTPQTVKENQVVKQPQGPTRSGYTFAGWYSDAKLTQAWDFKTMVKSDLTLYAKWQTAPVKKAPIQKTPISKKAPLKKGKNLPQAGEVKQSFSLVAGTLLLGITFVMVLKKAKKNANKI